MSDGKREQWCGRPVLGALLHGVALLLPLTAAFAVTVLVGRLLPAPASIWATVGRILLFVAVSIAVVWIVERQARRLLPMAALLKLTMVFPDRAPSRFAVARMSGRVSELEEQLERAREGGQDERALEAESILMLVTALSVHDRRTRGHSERVRVFTDMLGEELKLSADDRAKLRWAALLHDLGKVVVRPEVLNKDGSPTDDEWVELRRHPGDGARTAKSLAPWLGPWIAAIEDHHERWDGTGYPNRLKAENISMGGRIVAVADSFETMTAARAYKKAMSVLQAREELSRCAGTHFDPAIVRAFLNIGIGRQTRAAGPLAWLASLPFVNGLRIPIEVAARGLHAIGPQAAPLAAAAVISLPAVAGGAAVDAAGRAPDGRSAIAIRRTPIPMASIAVTAGPGATPTASAGPLQSGSPAPRTGATPRPVATAPPTPGPASVPTPSPRPVPPADAYYLASSGTGNTTSSPVLPFRVSAPTSRALPNYDTNRDASPGLLIAKGEGGMQEEDPVKYQRWTASPSQAVTLSGPVRLTVWSAMKDFKAGRGHIKAYLWDCNREQQCQFLAGGALNRPNWGEGSSMWVSYTVDLGTVSHTVPAQNVIVLKLVVFKESDDDMWFAYDTAQYPSVMQIG